MTPEAILAHLRKLALTIPDLGAGRRASYPTDPAVLTWLGQLTALVDQQSDLLDKANLEIALSKLGGVTHESGRAAIMQLLYIVIAKAELAAPASFKGAFIAVGSHFDAFTAIADVVKSATNRVLIIDPYLDSTAVSKFVVTVAEHIKVDLLSDSKSCYPDLLPSITAFQAQYGALRPIEARVTPKGGLHDRFIIIDEAIVWELSQSLKDFAARVPGGITKIDNELAALKLGHYLPAWQTAAVLA